LKELLELLVKALVDHPDEVEIAESASPDGITYEIHVAQEDLGKVIGKGGKIANALRTVVKAAAMKTHQRVYVEVVSDE
jgi:uncharacterized protein